MFGDLIPILINYDPLQYLLELFFLTECYSGAILLLGVLNIHTSQKTITPLNS